MLVHRRRDGHAASPTAGGRGRWATAPRSCACRRWAIACARRRPQSRVVTLSMKPRSAVMLAGHGGTAVTWFGRSRRLGRPRRRYAERAGARRCRRSSARNPVEQDSRRGVGSARTTRRRTRAPTTRVGERRRAGWTPLFPHPLAGAPGTPTERFLDSGSAARIPTRISAGWPRRCVDDYAARAARRRRLPRRQLLRPRLRRPRLRSRQPRGAGHADAARPHARRAARRRSTARSGRDRYALGAVGRSRRRRTIPEARRRPARRGGRVRDCGGSERSPKPRWRPRSARARTSRGSEYTELYLTDAARASDARSPRRSGRSSTRCERMPGVPRVAARRRPRAQARRAPIRCERAAALGHVPGRSGDVDGACLQAELDHRAADPPAAPRHGSLARLRSARAGRVLRRAVQAGPLSATPASPGRCWRRRSPSTVGLPMPGVDGRVLPAAP